MAEAEEAGGEDSGAEEPQEDGATDELEAGVLSLGAKPLPDAVQCPLQVTAPVRRRREKGRGGEENSCIYIVTLNAITYMYMYILHHRHISCL